MTSGIGGGSWRVNDNHTETAIHTQAGKTKGAQAGANSNRPSDPADVADISSEAKALSTTLQDPVDGKSIKIDGSAFSVGMSTYGEMAGTSNLGLKKYLSVNGQTGDTSLMAMNQNRKTLGGRIDSLIKAAGVTLGKDEKITVSVDGQDNIVVGGLKDKAKAEAIQKALNDDKRLARELKSHVVNGKISDAAKKQEAYKSQFGELTAGMDQDLDDMFTDRGVRTFVVDEYLRNNAGISLADLQFERDKDDAVSFIGLPAEVEQLFAEDGELAATVANILENGETAAGFSVSFEFANGAISDSTTDNAARDKIEDIKALIMGGVDKDGNIVPGMVDSTRELIESAGVTAEDEEYKQLMAMLSRGFSIQVKQNGEYEIVGAEDMPSKLVDIIKGLVDKALEQYAGSKSLTEAETDFRTNNFADVAETFIEQHRFEHGDVDEYAHAVEINFAGGRDAVKVVSPDADKAQEEKNRETADELGKQLKQMLEDEGVDVGGLEVEIDENGKMTVQGDPADANVRKAQQILDQFVQDAKTVSAEDKGGDEKKDIEENDETQAERRRIRGSSGNYYEGLKNKTWVEEKLNEIAPYLPGNDNSYQNLRMANLYLGWQTSLPKNDNGATYISNVPRVSTVKEPQYANLAGASEDGYAADAKGLYRKLLDGMGQFHDGRKDIKYTFAIG